MGQPTVVGIRPWLPWPLGAWRWWTEPVRAERLAALRIGLAAVLLIDLLTSYFPRRHDFFGPGSLAWNGGQDLFAWQSRAPHWGWSLLRGPGNATNLTLALGAAALATVWVFLAMSGRQSGSKGGTGLRWALALWIAATGLSLLGLWARLHSLTPKELAPTPGATAGVRLGASGLAWLLATAFLVLELRFRRRSSREGQAPAVFILAGVAWLLSTGFLLLAGTGIGDACLSWALENWSEDPSALTGAMIVWIAATILLLLGLGTRLSAVVVWVLSLSFANLNSSIDNAGDTVRGILLFYLMVSPCGAAWSLDRRLARRPAGEEIFIYPWPLRLIFLQMVAMYFVNGLCKLCGPEWHAGTSLYYVMGDLTLTRFSFAEFHLPFVVLQILAWTVLAWEAGFPLLVSLRWTRTPALVFGALFHLGIWASMELGGFAPYALCMYLPLVPWDKWVRAHGGSVA